MDGTKPSRSVGPQKYSSVELRSYTSNLSNKIGFGGYGEVYKGYFPGGVPIAVKVLINNDVNEDTFFTEVGMLGRAFHLNLVKFYGYCFEDSLKALVFEYMKNGSLDKILYENHHPSIEWVKLYRIAIDIARGLRYLHDEMDDQIIHHDIKASNVLLDQNFSAKITDLTRERGTFGYNAPETWMPNSQVTSRCDVYSFGMMLFEILGKRNNGQVENWFPGIVWNQFKSGKLQQLIKECDIKEEDKEKAIRLSKVALWCVQFTPERRPSMEDVVLMLQDKKPIEDPLDPLFPLLEDSTSQIDSLSERLDLMELDDPIMYPQNINADQLNVSIIAGKDATNDSENVCHTSLGEFKSTDSTARRIAYSRALLMKFTEDLSYRVGFGGFGDVYKGEFPNGVPIAVKVLKNTLPELMEKQFAAEVNTIGKAHHRNLIKLYGYCYEADMKALVYEYMEKGALDVFLKKNNLDMVKLYTIATEIARGISYLHEGCNPQIIHHDLKPANVLLDSEFSPKIIDFGLAKINMEKSQFAKTGLKGTHGYVAPEMTQQEFGMISYKCDVFSFGMILFDILKSKINYAGHRWLPGQIWEKFKENTLDSFLKDYGIKEDDNTNAKTLSLVALLCAEYNPRNRPSMSTVVKILEGEMTPRQPVNPFPFYDSSFDNSTTYDSRN